MKFLTSATLLGFLAFYSAQVLAQEGPADESKASMPTLTDSIASDVLPTTVIEPTSDLSSSAEPSSDESASSEESQLTLVPSATNTSSAIASTLPSAISVSSPTASASSPSIPETSVPSVPTESSKECQDGQYQCSSDSSPEFKWCVFGKWTPASCAQGTICKPLKGENIACDWPNSEI